MADPFHNNPDIWISSFWGFDPETWGCVGFTDESRRDTVKGLTGEPFLMVIYVTQGAPNVPGLNGKVAGFYEVTHEYILRDDAIAPHQINNPRHPPHRWKYCFVPSRAWRIKEAHMPTIQSFDPSIYAEKRYRAVSRWGCKLNKQPVQRLKKLWNDDHIDEVRVYPKKKI